MRLGEEVLWEAAPAQRLLQGVAVAEKSPEHEEHR